VCELRAESGEDRYGFCDKETEAIIIRKIMEKAISGGDCPCSVCVASDTEIQIIFTGRASYFGG
jgi:hypothetical protein